MDSRELSEWRALWRLRPVGEEAADKRMAVLAHVIYSLLRGKESPRIEPDEFIPWREAVEQTPEEQIAALKAALGPRTEADE